VAGQRSDNSPGMKRYTEDIGAIVPMNGVGHPDVGSFRLAIGFPFIVAA
jgi:hypothetical protein